MNSTPGVSRRIILMRHAKSAWPEVSDWDRPLAERGRLDAPRVARRFAELGWAPDHAACSSALRTRETLDLIIGALEANPAVAIHDGFYQGGVRDIRGAMAGLGDDVRTALFLGHNPGWEMAVQWFTGKSIRMTTANAALLEGVAVPWKAAAAVAQSWRLADVIRPKDL